MYLSISGPVLIMNCAGNLKSFRIDFFSYNLMLNPKRQGNKNKLFEHNLRQIMKVKMNNGVQI